MCAQPEMKIFVVAQMLSSTNIEGLSIIIYYNLISL